MEQIEQMERVPSINNLMIPKNVRHYFLATTDMSCYQLIIFHKFPIVDLEIETLSYYIYTDGIRSLLMNPILVSTSVTGNTVSGTGTKVYTSIYKFKENDNFLESVVDDNDNYSKLVLILPFDWNSSILGIEFFRYVKYYLE